jgi:hypothetical protein
VELKIGLRGEHGPGECAGYHHDQLGPETDLEHLAEEEPPADGGGKNRTKAIDRQQEQLPEVGAKAQNVLADQPNEKRHREPLINRSLPMAQAL